MAKAEALTVELPFCDQGERSPVDQCTICLYSYTENDRACPHRMAGTFTSLLKVDAGMGRTSS
jgi:hypothetical protein